MVVKIIAETSLARFEYRRGPNQHSSTPGNFYVHDKARDERYWEEDCYDGGEGFGNKDEGKVQREGIAAFLDLNGKYSKFQTDADKEIIAKITAPLSVVIDNPEYYGNAIRIRKSRN